MGMYAGLGVAQAVFSFAVSFAFRCVLPPRFRQGRKCTKPGLRSLITLATGLRMFKGALNGVLRSPVSFFDTTPMGELCQFRQER
jgi:ATP-binding cassette subfamily C (CFTR/MRP) protein 1